MSGISFHVIYHTLSEYLGSLTLPNVVTFRRIFNEYCVGVRRISIIYMDSFL